MEVHIVQKKSLKIAYATILIGIGLLAFTFINAFIFLANNPTITGTSGLVEAFGSALAPLIEASIRIMYLGVMGWIGLGLTTRGVHLLTNLKRLAQMEIQPVSKPNIEHIKQIRIQQSEKGKTSLARSRQK